MLRLKQVVVMVLLAVLLFPVIHFAQVKKKQDAWKPLRVLVGSWEGQGE